jgi:hypothetical protein
MWTGEEAMIITTDIQRELENRLRTAWVSDGPWATVDQLNPPIQALRRAREVVTGGVVDA